MMTQKTDQDHIPGTASIAVQYGEKMTRGTGFEAISFTHRQLDGLMDPLIMVDHFTMTAPTFGPHAHAGLSAVSVLFEDSTGSFRNRDSLGNDIKLAPGDLYWLKAAQGAVHDEAPTPGSRTHALQIFVNLPAAQKLDVPAARHVPASGMAIIKGEGHRVRVMTGQSNGVIGANSPALPFTILDIGLQAGGRFTHHADSGEAMWMHLIRGEIEADIDGTRHLLTRDTALATHGGGAISLRSVDGGQAVLLAGMPLREAFVQKGPFAMSNVAQMETVIAAHAAGDLGSIG